MVEGNVEVTVPYETIAGNNMVSSYSSEIGGSTAEGNPNFTYSVRWVHPGGIIAIGWPEDFAQKPVSDDQEVEVREMNQNLSNYVTILMMNSRFDEFNNKYGAGQDESGNPGAGCITYRI